ncbi:hypothetical protein FA15DRAFT_341972 [Coprinopsis marcescibilis]|uniref:Uncharacterized protein n=1 Tax=Coprinopsis marcescibilis TaxID=230819 RepID=A0A5C3KBF3_COPMA|nr:hypothetical protein FA15DRAFT_341972 [Coprinopsis marcescibilis]
MGVERWWTQMWRDSSSQCTSSCSCNTRSATVAPPELYSPICGLSKTHKLLQRRKFSLAHRHWTTHGTRSERTESRSQSRGPASRVVGRAMCLLIVRHDMFSLDSRAKFVPIVTVNMPTLPGSATHRMKPT